MNSSVTKKYKIRTSNRLSKWNCVGYSNPGNVKVVTTVEKEGWVGDASATIWFDAAFPSYTRSDNFCEKIGPGIDLTRKNGNTEQVSSSFAISAEAKGFTGGAEVGFQRSSGSDVLQKYTNRTGSGGLQAINKYACGVSGRPFYYNVPTATIATSWWVPA